MRFSRDADSARDIVQAAFEKALRHANSFRGDAKLSTWLHSIVANEARMWLRGERRRLARITPMAAIDALPIRDGDPGPEETFGRKREMESLARAVKRLSATDREVLFECALGGMSYERFGRERGLTRGAAKSRAHRARERLLHGLEDQLRPSG